MSKGLDNPVTLALAIYVVGVLIAYPVAVLTSAVEGDHSLFSMLFIAMTDNVIDAALWPIRLARWF